MRLLLLVVALGLSACGSSDGRIDMCGPCSFPDGSCADLDGTASAVCTAGAWKFSTAICTRPVCAVQFPNTKKGEPSYCFYDKGTCP